MSTRAKVVSLCTDLLFTSKIRETARVLDLEVVTVRDGAAMVEAARDAALVILDLRRPDALGALDALRANPATQALSAVGFCDHERVELLREAELRGCRALAKGKFSAELRHIMAASPAPAPGGAVD